jgi:hypothetical protein
VATANSTKLFSLTETIVQAVARLVDDAGPSPSRLPSHADLERIIARSGLRHFDPHKDPSAPKVGKHKRLREVLTAALDGEPDSGAQLVVLLIGNVRGNGGFRPDSPNFCGADAIATCIAAFSSEPVELTIDGELRVRSLEGLSGRQLSDAIRSYVDRARRGYEDSVLVAGTDKDLIEAVARHVIVERFNTDASGDFPTVLGQAFAALNLAAMAPRQEQGGLPGARDAMSVALYQMALAVNRLRNKAGAGHGRPFIPELSPAEVRTATEATGLVAGRLLDELGL